MMRALLALALMAMPAAATEGVEIALTDDRIAVDTGFDGARLTLFGAVTGIDDPSSVDIVSVIRGPDARFHIRQMLKNNLIWTSGPTQIISDVPGLYLTYATRPIDSIATLPLQAEHQLDAAFLDINVINDDLPKADGDLFRRAFLSEAEALGLYHAQIGGIAFKKGALFTVDARLPANTPVGDYVVAVYLFRDGELLGADKAALAVNRAGLEQRTYDFAHQRPITYGIFCVTLSLLAGWVASLAFRK